MRDSHHKLLIADEAARLLSEQSDLSLSQAKHKAAQQLGLGKRGALPDDNQVELALRTYQQLFQSQNQSDELRKLRQLALQAMHTFSTFQPRLVGRIKSGTADQHSAIQLRLFCEAAEEVIFCLMDNKIPWHEREIACTYTGNRSERHPLMTFQAGETVIELLLLPLKDRQNPPLGTTGSVPDKGLTIQQLEKLLA